MRWLRRKRVCESWNKPCEKETETLRSDSALKDAGGAPSLTISGCTVLSSEIIPPASWNTGRPSQATFSPSHCESSSVLLSERKTISIRSHEEAAIVMGMPKRRKFGKKKYASPSSRVLDPKAAKAELEARGESDDPQVQKMIRAIDQKLNAGKKLKSTFP